MKHTQKGFSAVEILLVVVVVGLLATAGWFVYSKQDKNTNNNQATDTQTPTVSEEQNAPSEEKDLTADWLLYESPNKAYTVRIADGWKLYHYDDASEENSLKSDYSKETVYKKGTKATVTVRTEGGRGGPAYFGLHYNEKCFTDNTTDQTNLKTNDGLTITKRTHVHENDNYDDRIKTLSYEVSSGDKTACIYYDQFKEDAADKPVIVEQVVKTFSFN